MTTAEKFAHWQYAGETLRALNADTAEAAYWRGYDAGEQATHDMYQRWLGVTRQFLTGTRPYAELQRARAYTDEPCAAKCGRCSRCIRAAAAVSNLATYGSPDYPGAGR